ncbi:MAG: 50S ribosomal protein L19 [Lentisphaerae bacterium]|nr:50S ribosomal protein L19 [Lentisphaerota bacterium]
MSQVIDKINAEQLEGREVPPFRVGDTVCVHVRIREGEKERIQNFTGTVIARDGAGSNETFTVRRISHGVGVERVFPVYSPHLAQIEVEREGKVKRAKLYFLRSLTGRKARMKIRSRR